MFFHLEPERAILSDLNWDLINVYRMVEKYPQDIAMRLRSMPVGRHAYYVQRALQPRGLRDRAVRFLYLNRTCFRGIYRVNRNGLFNVPYGSRDRDASLLFKTRILSEASARLKRATICVADFEATLSQCGAGDLVYCDPIYAGTSSSVESFSRYNEKLFSWCDHQRLADACRMAAGRGAGVIVSNSLSEGVARLFGGGLKLSVSRQNSLGKDRSATGYKEALFFLGNELVRHVCKAKHEVSMNGFKMRSA
jgi:DNA adenine methylase